MSQMNDGPEEIEVQPVEEIEYPHPEAARPGDPLAALGIDVDLQHELVWSIIAGAATGWALGLVIAALLEGAEARAVEVSA